MGFCGPKFALVYPFMPRLSLFTALHTFEVSILVDSPRDI